MAHATMVEVVWLSIPIRGADFNDRRPRRILDDELQHVVSINQPMGIPTRLMKVHWGVGQTNCKWSTSHVDTGVYSVQTCGNQFDYALDAAGMHIQTIRREAKKLEYGSLRSREVKITEK